MARKQKSSRGMATVATWTFILVVVIVAVPSGMRLVVALLAGIAGFIWLVKKSIRESSNGPPRPKETILPDSKGQTTPLSNYESKSEINLELSSAEGATSDFHVVRVSSPEHQFAIPKPKDVFQQARWICKDETITVSGHVIQGGMVYFAEKADRTFNQEPSLINGQLPVQAAHVDLTETSPATGPVTAASRLQHGVATFNGCPKGEVRPIYRALHWDENWQFAGSDSGGEPHASVHSLTGGASSWQPKAAPDETVSCLLGLLG